jgi:MFS family permease
MAELPVVESVSAYLWKIALRVGDHQTCLAASSIANHHKLLRVGRRLRDVGCLRHATGRGDAQVCADGAVAGSSALAADRFSARRQRSRRRDLFAELGGESAGMAVGPLLVAGLLLAIVAHGGGPVHQRYSMDRFGSWYNREHSALLVSRR